VQDKPDPNHNLPRAMSSSSNSEVAAVTRAEQVVVQLPVTSSVAVATPVNESDVNGKVGTADPKKGKDTIKKTEDAQCENELMSKYDSPLSNVSSRLFLGSLVALIAIALVFILTMSLSKVNHSGAFLLFIFAAVFTIGVAIPELPDVANHPVPPKFRVVLGQMNVVGFFLAAAWVLIGGIYSLVYVSDFVEDYCEEKKADADCGCDDLCGSDGQGLKDAAYAITVISTLIGVPFFVAFMEWTRDLVNLIEQELPESATCFSPILSKCRVLQIDGYCCCCCPGGRSKWTSAVRAADRQVSTMATVAGKGVAVAFEWFQVFIYIFGCCCCTTTFIIAGFICYSHIQAAAWIRVLSCIYVFVVWLALETQT